MLNKLTCWYIGFLVLYGCCSRKIKQNNKWYLGQLLPEMNVPELTSLTLVVAHPDDEVMFFSPSLLQFNELLPLNIPVKVICMTSGDADGMGYIRRQELVRSLQIVFHGRTFTSEVLAFEDGMGASWDKNDVRDEIARLVVDANPLVLTFDQFGVSGHINHVSSGKAVESLDLRHALYLKSNQPVYVKYSSFIPSILRLVVASVWPGTERPRMFISTLPQYLLSLSAMSLAHDSQMVWFRVGWWLFSRFCFVNELSQEYS